MLMRSAFTVSPDRGPVTATCVPTLKRARSIGVFTVPNVVCAFTAIVMVAPSVLDRVQLSPSRAVSSPRALGEA